VENNINNSSMASNNVIHLEFKNNNEEVEKVKQKIKLNSFLLKLNLLLTLLLKE
jgi:hypothetical protein